MKKIIHAITSLKVGGAETLLTQLAPKLQDSGYQILILYFHTGPNVEKLEKAGVKVKKFNSAWQFLNIVKDFKPDYIHSHLWYANLLSCLAGFIFKIPVIHTVHGVSEKGSINTIDSKESFIRWFLDKLFLRVPEKYILVSKRMEVPFVKNHGFIPAKKIQFIPNGLELKNVKNEKAIFDEDCFVFGCIGRFISIKRHADLIKAFVQVASKNSSVRLLLIGSGKEQPTLENLIEELNMQDKVKILFANNALGFYQQFDCYVTFSKELGMPVTLLEAMSFNVPVILHEDNVEIFDGLEGLTKFKTFSEGVAAMERMALEKDLRKRLAQVGKRCLEQKFTIQRTVEEYKKLYK